MSRFRVYINPFDEDGNYTSFVEVTDDVDFSKLGKIKQTLDNDEYSVGLFRFSDFSITLRNEHGEYSDVGQERSIFQKRRTDSQVKITWQEQDWPTECGAFQAGAGYICGNQEYEIFKGLLNDEASDLDLSDQQISFKVLGFESLLKRVEFPFSSVSPGDDVSDLIYAALNQSGITQLLTVDLANINPTVDVAVDDISDYENEDVKKVLDDLLQISNSVLYVDNDTVYVKERTPSATVQYTFYGQGSNDGLENIVRMSSIRSGRNRMFNLWKWDGTSLDSRNADSISDNRVRQKTLSFSAITNNTNRQSILDDYKTEFGALKQELNLTTYMRPDVLSLFLLDKVSIDYPTVFRAADNSLIPIYGVSVYGEARYPIGEWSLTIDSADEWKVMSREIDTKNQNITYLMREV